MVSTETSANNKTIWANLLHLGYNMWADRDTPEHPVKHFKAQPYLRFDVDLWNELTQKMADVGMNMVVIDLGEGVKYESHPELAVENSWTVDRLKQEIRRLRDLGLEPIPKMNFSACHDLWLGPYSRRLCTPEYYEVCRDLIAEVSDIFEKPRFFHIGMDEETSEIQRFYEYVVVRQHDLWWRDFNFFVEQVEKGGSRAWIWSDYLWHHPEPFWNRMPKSVIQSNWYYEDSFSKKINWVKAYLDLEEHGYDQVPTGSNWAFPKNFEKTVPFCKKNIAPERLLGFMTAPWHPTLMEFRDHHIQAIEQVARGIKRFESK